MTLPPGVACFAKALETGAWRHRKRSRVRARFLERKTAGERAALIISPRVRRFSAAPGYALNLRENGMENLGNFLEGGRIDGENMG